MPRCMGSEARPTSSRPARRLKPVADICLTSSTRCIGCWEWYRWSVGVVVFPFPCSPALAIRRRRFASPGLCVWSTILVVMLSLSRAGGTWWRERDRRCASGSSPGEALRVRTPQAEPRFEIVTFSAQSRYARVVKDGMSVRRSRVVNRTAVEPVYIQVNEEAVVTADAHLGFFFVDCTLDPSLTPGNSPGHGFLDPQCVPRVLRVGEKSVEQQVGSESYPFDFRFRCTHEWLQARHLAWEAALDTGATDTQKSQGSATPEGVSDYMREYARVRWFAFASVRTPDGILTPVYCSDGSPLFVVVGRDTGGDIWVPAGYRVALAEGASGEFMVCRRGLCTKETLRGVANAANTCAGGKAECTFAVSKIIPDESDASGVRMASAGADHQADDEGGADGLEDDEISAGPGEPARSEAKPRVPSAGRGDKEARKGTNNRQESRGGGRRKSAYPGNVGLTGKSVGNPGDIGTEKAQGAGGGVRAQEAAAVARGREPAAGGGPTRERVLVGRGAVEVICTPDFGFYVDPLQDPEIHDGRRYYVLGKTPTAKIYCEDGYNPSLNSGSRNLVRLAALLACFVAWVY